jgi:hypothetical protein
MWLVFVSVYNRSIHQRLDGDSLISDLGFYGLSEDSHLGLAA